MFFWLIFAAVGSNVAPDGKQQKSMNIRYNILQLKNERGSGHSRRFVHLQQQRAEPASRLEELAERNTTLTRADMKAALSVVREYICQELTAGHQVYLPEVGYFALSAMLSGKTGSDGSGIKANEIRVRTIRFSPEKQLLSEVRRKVGFRKAAQANISKEYTMAELTRRVTDYLSTHPYLTRRIMENEFQLTPSTAYRWLRRLVASGVLKKEGVQGSPYYTLGNKVSPTMTVIPHAGTPQTAGGVVLSVASAAPPCGAQLRSAPRPSLSGSPSPDIG